MVAAEADLLRRAGHEVVQYQVENPTGRAAAVGALGAGAVEPVGEPTVGRLAAAVRPDVAHVHNTWFSLSPSSCVA